MAFAALHVAIGEVSIGWLFISIEVIVGSGLLTNKESCKPLTCCHYLCLQIRALAATARDPFWKLTIITGRGTGPRTRDAYILSDAVQEILTEDFYPPIASSTVLV